MKQQILKTAANISILAVLFVIISIPAAFAGGGYDPEQDVPPVSLTTNPDGTAVTDAANNGSSLAAIGATISRNLPQIILVLLAVIVVIALGTWLWKRGGQVQP